MKKASLLQRPGSYIKNIRNGIYQPTSENLSLVMPTKKKGTYRISSPFRTCREFLIGTMIQSARGRGASAFSVDKARILMTFVSKPPYPQDRMDPVEYKDFIEASLKDHKEKIENGMKLLHTVEDEAGWPRSTVYEMIPKRLYPNASNYMVVGSKRWVKTPYAFSLFVLLIRLGRYKDLFDFDNYQDLIKKCTDLRIIENERRELLNNGARPVNPENRYIPDRYQVAMTYQHWLFFMKNQTRIFKGLKYKEAFAKSSAGYHGIASFTSLQGSTNKGAITFWKNYQRIWKNSKQKKIMEALLKERKELQK